MAKKETSTAVAETKNGNMIIGSEDMPEYLRGKDVARGSENVTMDDLVIPRLEVVQGLSPAVKRGDPLYIEGAQAGDLNNSVTRQLYGEEVYVVNVHFSVQYLVWQARRYIGENGKEITTEGGFFGAFPTEHEANARAAEEGGAAKGIEVIDTPQHFCLALNVAPSGEILGAEEILISMPRTKAKISRQWNSLIKLNGGDRFSRVYRLSTELEKNAKGDYYNLSVKVVGFPPEEVYKRAEALYESIAAGERRVVMDVNGLDTGGEAAPATTDSEM
jgi:hypothetical protein